MLFLFDEAFSLPGFDVAIRDSCWNLTSNKIFIFVLVLLLLPHVTHILVLSHCSFIFAAMIIITAQVVHDMQDTIKMFVFKVMMRIKYTI